jgi:hypothetical protein
VAALEGERAAAAARAEEAQAVTAKEADTWGHQLAEANARIAQLEAAAAAATVRCGDLEAQLAQTAAAAREALAQQQAALQAALEKQV